MPQALQLKVHILREGVIGGFFLKGSLIKKKGDIAVEVDEFKEVKTH